MDWLLLTVLYLVLIIFYSKISIWVLFISSISLLGLSIYLLRVFIFSFVSSMLIIARVLETSPIHDVPPYLREGCMEAGTALSKSKGIQEGAQEIDPTHPPLLDHLFTFESIPALRAQVVLAHE